jgi:hypothetical protein
MDRLTLKETHPSTEFGLPAAQTNGYDDNISDEDSAEGSLRKPLEEFDIDSTLIEDGLSSRPSRSRRKRWWERMVIRARRKHSLDGLREVTEGLLAGSNPRRRIEGKRTWYNYCIFGGISGLTVLYVFCARRGIIANVCRAFLLIVNLALGFATLMWSSDIDPTLRYWGKPGTGTEGLAWYPTDFLRDVIPIPCHSHNDYWRRVPLFDALRAGCTGVEADVWLFDNDLYVGHNTASLTRNRTFTSLYIDPIVKILEHQNPSTEFYNGTDHGVFDTDPGKSLTLLVDVKTGGKETWPWVLKQLQPLRDRGWLSYVENNTLHTGPVTVVGTGNTPFDILTQNKTYRDAFFDAPLDNMWEPRHTTPSTAGLPEFDDGHPGEFLDEGEGSAEEDMSSRPQDAGQGMSGVLPTDEFTVLNSYYASVSFGQAVGRMWRGRLSPRQMRIIRGQIRGAKRRGLKTRYWDLPSWPLGLRNHVWDVLVREGVDVLNVDDLRGVSKQVW